MRSNVRQTPRTNGTPTESKLYDMFARNAERIATLLTFPPMMLAADADAARRNAAQLQMANDEIRSLLFA